MKAADVMSTEIVSVGPHTPVAEVAGILLKHRISAVPVVDANGGLLGIVSEGDLVRRAETGTELRRAWWLELLTGNETLAGEFARAHGLHADQVMTRDVVTAAEDTPLAEIATLLETHGIKRVPIVSKGRKLAGIVSRANLVQAFAMLALKSGSGSAATTATAAAKSGRQPTDRVVRQRVLAQFAKQRWYVPWAVTVTVRHGVVHLWGAAPSEAERQAVRVAAETTPGVRDVKDHLAIETILPAI